MRICSLLPGATEVVAELGLAAQLVGISHECDYPEAVRGAPVLVDAAVQAEQSSAVIDRHVRDTLASGRPLYTLDEAGFVAARPDLVITQDLCHVCAVTPDQLQGAIGRLSPPPHVLSLNPQGLQDVLKDIARIGQAVRREAEAHRFTDTLSARLYAVRDALGSALAQTMRPRVVCLEWLDPLFVGGHWVPEMVECAGGRDVLGTPRTPSVETTWEQVVAAAPDVLVVMPCGFTLERIVTELARLPRPAGWRTIPAVQHGRVFAVDANAYFSRPGPRLVHGVELLAALLHPTAFGNRRPPGTVRVAS